MASSISALALSRTDVVSGQKVFAANEVTRIDRLNAWATEVADEVMDLATSQTVAGVKDFTGGDLALVKTQTAGNNSTKAASTAFVKAAVDAGGKAFGSWETTVTKTAAVPTSETDEIASTLAATDLVIHGCCYNTGTSSMRCNFKGYTDAGNPPTTIRGRMSLWGDGQTIAGAGSSFTMFVKKGDYYKVTARGQSGYVNDVDRTYDRIAVS